MASNNFYTLKDIYPQSRDAFYFEFKKIDEIKNDELTKDDLIKELDLLNNQLIKVGDENLRGIL